MKTGALLRQVHRYSEAIPRGVDCILRARGRRPQTHSADAGRLAIVFFRARRSTVRSGDVGKRWVTREDLFP